MHSAPCPNVGSNSPVPVTPSERPDTPEGSPRSPVAKAHGEPDGPATPTQGMAAFFKFAQIYACVLAVRIYIEKNIIWGRLSEARKHKLLSRSIESEMYKQLHRT